MGSVRLSWVLSCALGASACIGGQSGHEGETDPPSRPCPPDITSSVSSDAQTELGSARALVDSLSALQTAELVWHDRYPRSPDSADSPDTYQRVFTTLTLALGGGPGQTATFHPAFGDSCLATLEVSGVVLRFQTADGGAQELVPGVVTLTRERTIFEGTLRASSFVGGHDLLQWTAGSTNPTLTFRTSFSPPQGQLWSSGEQTAPNVVPASGNVASWGPGTP